MRTVLDSNVLSALWSHEASATSIAARLLQAKQAGAVVVSAVVYAELFAYPGATESFVNDFLKQTGITVDFNFEKAAWIEAGRRFARYAARRRRSTHPEAKRLLADFLIGAHALMQADRLMTLDPGRYQRDFPEVRLVAN